MPIYLSEGHLLNVIPCSTVLASCPGSRFIGQLTMQNRIEAEGNMYILSIASIHDSYFAICFRVSSSRRSSVDETYTHRSPSPTYHRQGISNRHSPDVRCHGAGTPGLISPSIMQPKGRSALLHMFHRRQGHPTGVQSSLCRAPVCLVSLTWLSNSLTGEC